LFWSKAKIKKVSAPNSPANKKRDAILDISKIAKALNNAIVRPIK